MWEKLSDFQGEPCTVWITWTVTCLCGIVCGHGFTGTCLYPVILFCNVSNRVDIESKVFQDNDWKGSLVAAVLAFLMEQRCVTVPKSGTKYYKSDELLAVPFLVSLVLAVVIHHGRIWDDWRCAVLVLSGKREEEAASHSLCFHCFYSLKLILFSHIRTMIDKAYVVSQINKGLCYWSRN